MKKKIQLSRIEMAILTVLFKAYPLALSKKEVEQKIVEEKLLEMTEEEFEKYMKDIIASKNN